MRGGRSEFDWNEVKDKARKDGRFRENYIGQSVKTQSSWVWQGGGVMGAGAPTEEELEEVRRRDAAALEQTLYGKPKSRTKTEMSKYEMEQVLQRGKIERDDKDAPGKMGGVGIEHSTRLESSGTMKGFDGAKKSVLEGTEGTEGRGMAIPQQRLQLDDDQREKEKEKEKGKKKHKRDKKDKKKKKKKDKRKRSRSRSRSRSRQRHDSPNK